MPASQDGISRLRWQCRRGMRELDELLTRYLECDYVAAGQAEKVAFESLLQLSDPDLIGYLLQQRPLPPELAHVIEKIQHRTDA